MNNPYNQKQNLIDLEPEYRRQTIEWPLLFQWILATTIGWGMGWAFIPDLGIGLVIGLAQWLVLRSHVAQAGWWIWASTVGWVVGSFVIIAAEVIPPGAGIAGSFVAGIVLGVMMGVAQAFTLHRWVHSAILWILASGIGWGIGFSGLLGGSVVGAVAGAITGLALDWLLRNPRSTI